MKPTKPNTNNPRALSDWLHASDVRAVPFKAIESARRIAAATPCELLAVAVWRYRRSKGDSKAKLRIIARRMGKHTTIYIVSPRPGRSVRAKTLAGVIRKAATCGWSAPPKYLHHILDYGYKARGEV
jgi:hypothetical protein